MRALAIVLLLLSHLAGCAKWMPERTTESKSVLPAPQLSPDSVTIETVLVRFPVESMQALDEVWKATDESIIELQQRRHLDKNGLRVGVIMGELPAVIREQLHRTSSAQANDALEYAGLASDVDNRMRQLSCRAGRRKELILRREIADPLSIVTTRDGVLSGNIFDRATALFDLRVIPFGDGTATLRLTPEVHHGEQQQSYVSSEFGVRPEIRRQQEVWRDLTIEANLQPQTVLIVASTQPPKALGQAFFMTRTAERTEENVILLIRLSRTQLDDLFAPELVEQARALTEQ